MRDEMPEAKSSVSYSLVSKDGFDLIFTVRSSDEAELMEEMETMEKHFITSGYAPRVRGSVTKTAEPARTGGTDKCPKCGSDLITFTSKDGTKSGMKCSTSKWNPYTKTASGCDYVKFDDDISSGNKSSTQRATEAQMNLLKDKDLWREGMTKEDASKTIAQLLNK